MSHVYFIKPVGMDGPIKIGFSKKPLARLAVLSAWSPFVLEIIGQADGSSREENMLHRRFAHLHTHREWFMTSPELRQAIERIVAGETIKSVCQKIPEVGSIPKKTRLVTPERKQFIEYGARIRKALFSAKTQGGFIYAPLDVRAIMDDWRGRPTMAQSIRPTATQIQRIEEFLSDPVRHGAFVSIERIRDHSIPFEEKLANPDCHPMLDQVAA